MFGSRCMTGESFCEQSLLSLVLWLQPSPHACAASYTHHTASLKTHNDQHFCVIGILSMADIV